jgi:predicted metalloendopeptidase
MNRSLVFLLLLAALAWPAVAEESASTTTTDTATEATGFTSQAIAADVLSAMDRDADPCQDFYRYACGGWIDSTEMPSDQTRWVRSFSVIRERNRENVREMLEEAAAKPGPAGTDRHRIGTYYAACMDEAAVTEAGTKPLQPLLASIAEVKDPKSFLAVTGKLHRIFADATFSGAVLPDFKDPSLNIGFFFQGGLGMPDRDYYVSDDEKKQELLAAYEKHVAHMLTLLGGSAEESAADAAKIVAFETRLAEASRPRAEMRNFEKLYNRLDLSGLQELTPKLPWSAYFQAIGHPDVKELSIATPEFFEALEAALLDTDPEVLRAYLRWHLVDGTAELLPEPFVTADFDFYGRQVQGQQEIEPRWKRCVSATEGALGEAVGKVFVDRYFAGSSKKVALEMIHDIQKAFELALPELSWMDEATREAALDKAVAVSEKIGYPDDWRDYSKIELRPESYFGNALATRAFEFDRQVSKVGGPVDPEEWGMTPQMVNAYYNPLQNEIVFPAGILQPPFFHHDFPAAMNYGAIGAVMGHELSHGFDDQGRKFAPDGQMREWWAQEASERFEKQAQCVSDLYSTYEPEPGLNLDGDLTLGENIADIGGVKQAYQAYQLWKDRHGDPEVPVEGLTDDQLFFVAFGQVWCGLITPEQMRLRVTTDSHSLPRYRVVGPVSNNRAFAEAFSCEPGTPMAPKERCEVW